MIRALVISLFAFLPLPSFADSLVAARVVRPNAIIVPADISIVESAVPGALSSKTEIVGLEARITLYPGRPILPEHVGPAAIIERNQPVVVTYRHGGLSIETEARALSRGAVGDVVRVMNLSSRSTVSGVVQPGGTIEVRGERESR